MSNKLSKTFSLTPIIIESDITVVPYTDQGSQNIFEHYDFYNYNEFPTTTLPNGYLYNGQEKYDKERKLYDQISTERINLSGVVSQYLVTSFDTEADPHWGEDGNREFKRKFDLMVMPDGQDLFQHAKQWGELGLWSTDVYRVAFTMTHFKEASTKVSQEKDDNLKGYQEGFSYQDGVVVDGLDAPRIGDYIKMKYEDYLYEIIDIVDEENQFMQGQNNWTITIKPYKDENISVTDDPNFSESMADISDIVDTFDMLDVREEVKSEEANYKYLEDEEVDFWDE
jgi:hypothetical protein